MKLLKGGCHEIFNGKNLNFLLLFQLTMPPVRECEGCCVKMVQFIGTGGHKIGSIYRNRWAQNGLVHWNRWAQNGASSSEPVGTKLGQFIGTGGHKMGQYIRTGGHKRASSSEQVGTNWASSLDQVAIK